MARRRKKIDQTPFECVIEDLSHDGRGVARDDGKTIFVHGALAGERVMVKRTAKRRQFDEGVAVEILAAAPDRVDPKCPHFGVCGGCALQHLEADAQIAAKQSVLAANFARIGKVTPESWLEPLVGDRWGYRRRARLSVRHVPKKGRVLVGFREKAGRFVADMEICHVLIPEVGMRIDALATLIDSLEIRDQIPQVEVAAGDNATVLIFRHMVPLSDADKSKLQQFAQSTGLKIWLQSKGPDTIVPLTEDDATSLFFSLSTQDLSYRFSPNNFVQVNADMNQRMIDLAIEKLALNSDHEVLDLFCGLGNFTLPIAQQAKHVLGIEGSAELIELARENASKNKIGNAEFAVADLTEPASQELFSKTQFDRILIDPPRSGAMEVMGVLNAKRLVYISCHPGSLARDAGLLVHEHGYRLVEAGVMDMFPHTAHVESIAVFERD